MKHQAGIIFLLGGLICLIIIITGSSCANIIPPGGGPKDSIPPRLVSALPRDSSNNVRTKQIILTFDEYVEMKDAQTNLVVSPVPKNFPIVDYKLKNVTIKLRDSLESNTTYSFDFGNSIKDVNEGNIAKNFKYVFSTGKVVDYNKFSGSVILAETGKYDSTLIVILHRNLNDTAIIKIRPRYYTRVDSKGNFAFSNLPEGKFAVYVLPNDYSKKYDDSTKIFGFSDTVITISKSTPPVVIYAYEEMKSKPKSPPANVNTTNSGKNAPKEDKRLRITTNLENGQQDVLNPSLQLIFTRKLRLVDNTKIILTDTNYHPLEDYHISLDSTKTRLAIQYKWPTETNFRLLLTKDAVTDTTGTMLTKGDTLKFATKKETDYGSIKLRFGNPDFSKNLVLQLVQNDKIAESIPVTQKEVFRKLYQPGEYELRILYDRNKNGIWDTGNFKKKIQPEVVHFINKKLLVKANWDNEMDVPL
jgi:hypothetical protein